jgi:hypothetical protein
MCGPTCIVWANLTPFSLQILDVELEAGASWTYEVPGGMNNAMFYAGMLAQGGPGGQPGPLIYWPRDSIQCRNPTQFPLNSHGV